MSNSKSFEEEVVYLDFAQENIQLRRVELDELINSPGGATPASGYHVKRAMKAVELPDSKSPYFTRVDLENGETLYYGFGMLTLAKESKPVPKSHPGVSHWLVYHIDNDGKGYRALPLSDLPEVKRRVRISIKNGKLIEIREELRGTGSKSTASEEVLAADLLTATMAETRGESLGLVGSTLQPDQFKVSRSPNDTILAVQGPPGSGKTVVLLERLSRIAFKDPSAREKGLVLIGPNQRFLDYVEEALVTLGKQDVITSTVEGLTKWKYDSKKDHESIEIIKARRVMESVIDELLLDTPKILESNYEFKVSDINVQFTIRDSYELLAIYREDEANYELKKQKAANTVLGILTERFFLQWEEEGKERSRFQGDPKEMIQQTSTFKTMMRNMYPDITPENALKKLKKNPNDFIRYAARNMEFEDIDNWLYHVASEEFEIRESDIPILDYLDFCIRGKSGTSWGHIAIDEAQNLTPMQLRMLARRIDHPSAISMTGDLAQGIGTIYYEEWDDIAAHFDSEEIVKTELTRSYRVPKDIIDYSVKFLEKAEVNVSAAEPFLDVEDALNLKVTSRDRFLIEAQTIASEHLANQDSVLIIATDETRQSLSNWNPGTTGGAHIKVYSPTEVKGLEFDVVIVVDPVGILRELEYEIGRSARLMYVNVTRSTKKLYMIGSTQDQVFDPVNAYASIETEDYESKIAELLGDMTEYAEEPENDVERNLIGASLNPLSVPTLCRNFGIEISTINQNHSSGKWKYLGSTQSRCIDCGSKPQLFFGEIELQERYAIVCTRCEVIRDEVEYEPQAINEILDELEITK
jgi:DNA helicase IV